MGIRPILGIIIAVISMIQISCKSEKESFVEKRDKEMSKAWTLLDYAEKCEEIDMNVPLGFVLGCFENEFYSHCEQLGKQYGGQKYGTMYQLYTKEFAVQDSVLISHFNYFSDPNTETDIVDEVSFILSDVGLYDTPKIDKVINVLDEKLTDWDKAEFNATEDVPSSKYDNYNKFWVKNNLAVHLEVNFHTTVISFMNTPKHGTKWIKEWTGETIQISEEVSKKIHERANLPKIQNSVWDGSVYQVKNYLKRSLKDPDSYEGIEWSNVIENSNGTYTVRHKYRARNSFGGMVVENWMFVLDEHGNVISSSQL